MPGTGYATLSGASGCITNIADPKRPLSALKIGNNINMITQGVLTNRYAGWTRQRQSTFNGGAAFLEFAAFTSSANARTLCFQVGDDLLSYDGATETVMQSGLSTSGIPCIRMFTPYADGIGSMLYANGIDQPVKFAATSAASGTAMQLNGGNYPQALTAPLPTRTYTKPKFIEQFLDRMIITGFDSSGGANTAFDVLITDAGTFESCTQTGAGIVASDGGLFTCDPDLGPITGAKAFKLSNEANAMVALVGQSHGISIILGTNALDFKMYTLTAEYGVPSNRCWVQMQNDLWFLASDGIRRFSSLAANANLLNATMSMPIQDLLNRISTSAASKAHMTHHRNVQEVVLWFPVDGSSTNNAAIIINYNTGGGESPEQIRPIFFTKDGTTVAAAIDFQGVMYGGGYTGILQKHYDGNLYDTVAVQWQILHAQLAPERKREQFQIEECTIETSGGSQRFLVNCYFYEKVAGSLRRNQAIPVDYEVIGAGGGGTVLDSWVLGSSALPEDGVKHHEIGWTGIGRKAEIELKGNMPNHLIDYVETEVKMKVTASYV